MNVSLINSEPGSLSGFKQEELSAIPRIKTAPAKRVFVIHRHLSSVLHYDLRIQVGGVLKSWALPSGPSMNASDRRFAIAIDDKPLDFATSRGLLRTRHVDGVIEFWDKGIFVPHSVSVTDSAEAELQEKLNNGRISFSLRGKKLQGVFTLIRLTDPRHWVLLKGNDRFATNGPYDPELLVDAGSRINLLLEKK